MDETDQRRQYFQAANDVDDDDVFDDIPEDNDPEEADVDGDDFPIVGRGRADVGSSNDDGFEFDDADFGGRNPRGDSSGGLAGTATMVANQPYDEAISVSDDSHISTSNEDVSSDNHQVSGEERERERDGQRFGYHDDEDDDSDGGRTGLAATSKNVHPGMEIHGGRGGRRDIEEDDDEVEDRFRQSDGDYSLNSYGGTQQPHHPSNRSNAHPNPLNPTRNRRDSLNDDEEDDLDDLEDEDDDSNLRIGDHEDDEDDRDHRDHLEGFGGEDEGDEVTQLFRFVGQYEPHAIEPAYLLRPHIPDYVPSVGDIDAFIKVPSPSAGEDDTLGLCTLDEPASKQSDPTVIDLQIMAVTKISSASKQQTIVRSIENAEKNGKAIDKWVESVEELHKNRPAPSVNYSKNMPDIEQLMQVWPSDFEELLNTMLTSTENETDDRESLGWPSVDLDLKSYAKVLCALLDVPMYGNVVESVHVLFTLYSEFRANQHFQQEAM